MTAGKTTSRRRRILIGAAVALAVALVAWLVFRPPTDEKAKQVNRLLRRQYLEGITATGFGLFDPEPLWDRVDLFQFAIFDRPKKFRNSAEIDDLGEIVYPRTHEDILVLSNLPELKELRAQLAPGLDLTFLSTLPKLEEMSIGFEGPPPDLTPIAELPNLKELRMSSFMYPLNLQPLGTAAQLEDLTIWFTRATSIQPLTRMTSLRRLTLVRCGSISDMDVVGKLINLRSVSIYDCTLTTTQLLSTLHELEKLTLHDTQLQSLSGVENLSKLTNLSVKDSPQITEIKELQLLHRLERVFLRDLGISDLSPLASLPNLRDVSIVKCPKVTDLSPLKKLSRLERIHVVNCGTSDVLTLEELK